MSTTEELLGRKHSSSDPENRETPTLKEEIRRYSSQYSPRLSAHPNGLVATRQQAIAKTPAKWSAYQIPSVIVVFVVLVWKAHSQKP
jgi:hypothetical protein